MGSDCLVSQSVGGLAIEEPDLRYLFGTPRGEAPIKLRCPHHDEDTASYAVYPDHAYCFGCGKWDSAQDVYHRLGTSQSAVAQLPRRQVDYLGKGRRSSRQEASSYPYSAAVELWHQTLTQGPRQCRIDYLYDRGLTLETVRQHRLGHDGERFTIPYRGGDSTLSPRGRESGCLHEHGSRGNTSTHQRRLVVWEGIKKRRDPRYCDPDEPKYFTYGLSSAIYRPNPGGRPVVICEGEFDALLFAQYGVDAITVSSGAKGLAKVQTVVRLGSPLITTDIDDAGDKAWEGLRLVFPNARRLVWPERVNGKWCKDISDYLLAYPVLQRGQRLRELLEG